MLDNYQPSLRQQALYDLTQRARGGIFIYLATWLVAALWADVPGEFPVFFYFNTFVFTAIAVARATHYLMYRKTPDKRIELMSRWLILSILTGAFHWGLMAAWIVHDAGFDKLKYVWLIIMAAFAIGGASTLSISREIRFLFPVFIFGPTVSMSFYLGGSENHVLVFLAVISMIYVYEASRVSARDYMNAITNQQFAHARAKMLEEISVTDALTQLKNRMYFNMKFSEEWKRCDRLQSPLSVMMLDLDHFKKLNDTYGHFFGDECLQEVAAILTRELPRETDTVARYGGEEFTILLPDTAQDDAMAIAARLVKEVAAARLSFEGQPVSLTCSIGLATTIPDRDHTGEALMLEVDKALYRAKDNGRNRYCIAAQTTSAGVSARVGAL